MSLNLDMESKILHDFYWVPQLSDHIIILFTAIPFSFKCDKALSTNVSTAKLSCLTSFDTIIISSQIRLHSSNCIACQWEWNRCKDMAFTDWMNFISNRARGPLYLILSMTHFFLPSFSPVSKSIYCHWCHVTCLLQSTSGFCFIMDSCSVFIAPHFLQFLKMQSQL